METLGILLGARKAQPAPQATLPFGDPETETLNLKPELGLGFRVQGLGLAYLGNPPTQRNPILMIKPPK